MKMMRMQLNCKHPASSSIKEVMFSSIQQEFRVLMQLLFLLKSDYFHQYNYSLGNISGAILTGFLTGLFWRGYFVVGLFCGRAILTGLFCGRAILTGYFDGAPSKVPVFCKLL